MRAFSCSCFGPPCAPTRARPARCCSRCVTAQLSYPSDGCRHHVWVSIRHALTYGLCAPCACVRVRAPSARLRVLGVYTSRAPAWLPATLVRAACERCVWPRASSSLRVGWTGTQWCWPRHSYQALGRVYVDTHVLAVVTTLKSILNTRWLS